MTKTLTAALISLTATIAAGCTGGQLSVSASASAADPALVKRGEYLVSMIGCTDCHTPLKLGPQGPEPDMARFLSGHPEQVGKLQAPTPQDPWIWGGTMTNTAFFGPWGVTYAANLTPDQNTGLGIWTEEMFIKAIRTGRHMGASRPILPPMPWQSIGNATDDDLKGIYAYLRSIKPVINHVPDIQPAEPIF